MVHPYFHEFTLNHSTTSNRMPEGKNFVMTSATYYRNEAVIVKMIKAGKKFVGVDDSSEHVLFQTCHTRCVDAWGP